MIMPTGFGVIVPRNKLFCIVIGFKMLLDFNRQLFMNSSKVHGREFHISIFTPGRNYTWRELHLGTGITNVTKPNLFVHTKTLKFKSLVCLELCN